jgi:hypothetical protein
MHSLILMRSSNFGKLPLTFLVPFLAINRTVSFLLTLASS